MNNRRNVGFWLWLPCLAGDGSSSKQSCDKMRWTAHSCQIIPFGGNGIEYERIGEDTKRYEKIQKENKENNKDIEYNLKVEQENYPNG